MATKLAGALSPEGVYQYHYEKSVANYAASYYSEDGRSAGVWIGEQAVAMGFEGGTPADELHVKRLAYGQDPHTGTQLIEWHHRGEAKESKWVRDDGAWRDHVEKLFAEALEDGREVFRAGEVSPLPRGERKAEVARTSVERTDREKALLEMHAIARKTFAENLERIPPAQDYLRKRGIRMDTARKFGLGVASMSGHDLADRLKHYGPELMEASGLFNRYCGRFVDRFRGRLMFPIENEHGETIAFAGRAAPGDKGPKYVNSPGTEIYQKGEELYNLYRASEHIRKTGEAVVVEGYLDAIAAHQAGARNVVAASGTALRKKQAATLAERASVAILNLDSDHAGRNATDKQIASLLEAGIEVRVLRLDGAKDVADWLLDHRRKEYKRALRESAPLMSYLAQRVGERFELADAYAKTDAIRWMAEMLEHVPAANRAKMGEALENHLQVPKVDKAVREKTVQEHRAAWDATISAPKTVSLTALVGGDTRVVKAHDEAIWEAAKYWERAIQVKMGGLNAPQTTGRMVAVAFRHDTARPVDGYAAPQLHTHLVIFNMSQDRDGQYRALEPRELYHMQTAAEAVYQNALAVRLKKLGYELEYGKKLAVEIRGYTQEYRDTESKRTAIIEAKQRDKGMYGPQANDNSALETREPKLEKAPEEVRAMHLEHAAQYFNQPQRVVEEAQTRKGKTYSAAFREQLADAAVEFAKARLSERTTVMEWHEVYTDALRYGRGYIALRDVEAGFARARDRGEFQRVEHWRAYAPESRWTTPELQAKEREILGWMAAGRGKVSAIAGGITKDEFREQFKDHLNNSQKHLVWNLIHSEDRMVGTQGRAGAGKTRVMATVKDFAERYGYEVRGLAATTTAVNELRKVGIAAETLAAFQVRREDRQRRPRAYLLDEATLTDVHQMSSFLRELKPADRVIVIGDTRQHGSLGAGRMFAELQEAGMQTFHLRKIVRQKDPEYRAVIEDFSEARIKEAIEKLEYKARIHEFENERTRFKAIALKYLRAPERTVVVSPDNRSVTLISEAIRAERAEAQQFGEQRYRARILKSRTDMTEADVKLAATYQVGDVIVYARNTSLESQSSGRNIRKLRKDDRASVIGVDRERNVVTVLRESDGAQFSYNPRRVATTASVYEPIYREFAAGERVQFTKTQKADGIANGTRGTIRTIDGAGSVSVELDGGSVWRGNMGRMPYLDYGYVTTSYRAQSITDEIVLLHVDLDSGSRRMVTRELGYVGLSRGVEEGHVYASSREGLIEALSRSEQRPQALAPEEISSYRAEKRFEKVASVA